MHALHVYFNEVLGRSHASHLLVHPMAELYFAQVQKQFWWNTYTAWYGNVLPIPELL